MKTFSSIYPFTNRLELRRATCITSGAESGGGGWTEKKDAAAKRWLKEVWYMFTTVGPRMDFATQALDVLDKFESGLEGQEREEIAKAEELQKEGSPRIIKSHDPDFEKQLLRRTHRVVLPLNARYTALVSAVAGMEWLVALLHKGCRHQADKFIQAQAKKAGIETVPEFKSAMAIIRSARPGWGRSYETLKDLAKIGGVEDKKSSLEEFRALYVVRHAIVHCGGRVEDVRDSDRNSFRAAVKRLNFRVLTKVEINGEEFDMPMAGAHFWGAESGQLWIGRDALREPVKRALDFINEVHKAYFG